jgi:hypothetical protein
MANDTLTKYESRKEENVRYPENLGNRIKEILNGEGIEWNEAKTPSQSFKRILKNDKKIF